MMKKIFRAILICILTPIYLVYCISRTVILIAETKLTGLLAAKVLDKQSKFLCLSVVVCEPSKYNRILVEIMVSTHILIRIINLLCDLKLADKKILKPLITELEVTIEIADKNYIFLCKIQEMLELNMKTTVLYMVDKAMINSKLNVGDKKFLRRVLSLCKNFKRKVETN